MRAARKTPEEQYRLVMECRKSGMSDCDWCRANGINPETFYTWITRLREKGGFPIPPAQKQPSCQSLPHDIVRVDVLPEESLLDPNDDKNTFTPPAMVQTVVPSIEIEANGATFRFTGTVNTSLYEKTLLMIGGRL